MICYGLITSDTLVNAIDTCRIFETSFNFWDGDGDGWDVLRFDHNRYSTLSTTEAEPVAALYSWLVKSSSPDITGNFIVDKVWQAIYVANDDFANFVDLFLGLSPPGVLDDNAGLLQRISFLLSSHILRENWKIVSLLLAWGADPHHVYAPNRHSPVAASPLLFAMYSLRTFCAFRHALHGRDFDLKDFARKELEEGRPLLEAGWQMETLTAFLELEIEHDTAPRDTRELHCDICNGRISLPLWESGIQVQPYWQVILESIKNGSYQQRNCSDIQNEQASNNQRDFTVLNDSTTDTTDDSALSQDPALSEIQAAHPDQESPTNGVDMSSTIFDRKEIWCVLCWYLFKESGRWSPASETESSDDEDASEDDASEDDASEDDFSPYLIHT